jgi:hypothetical protein
MKYGDKNRTGESVAKSLNKKGKMLSWALISLLLGNSRDRRQIDHMCGIPKMPAESPMEDVQPILFPAINS